MLPERISSEDALLLFYTFEESCESQMYMFMEPFQKTILQKNIILPDTVFTFLKAYVAVHFI